MNTDATPIPAAVPESPPANAETNALVAAKKPEVNTEAAAGAADPALPPGQMWQLLVENAQTDRRFAKVDRPASFEGYTRLPLDAGLADGGLTMYLPKPGSSAPIYAVEANLLGDTTYRLTPADIGNPKSYWSDQIVFARGDRRLIKAELPADVMTTHQPLELRKGAGEKTAILLPKNGDLSTGVFVTTSSLQKTEVRRLLVDPATGRPAPPPSAGKLGELTFEAPLVEPGYFDHERTSGLVYFRANVDEAALRKEYKAGLKVALRAFDANSGKEIALDPKFTSPTIATRDYDEDLGDIGSSFGFNWSDEVPIEEGGAHVRFELTLTKGDEHLTLGTDVTGLPRPIKPMGLA